MSDAFVSPRSVPAVAFGWGLLVHHKWRVFQAGWRLGVPLWRLVIHDWSKVLPSEFVAYRRVARTGDPREAGYVAARNGHANRSPHHWTHWIPRVEGTGADAWWPSGEALEMPLWAVREMVADWIGATRVYTGSWPSRGGWPWFEQSFPHMVLHPATRRQVVVELARWWCCSVEQVPAGVSVTDAAVLGETARASVFALAAGGDAP